MAYFCRRIYRPYAVCARIRANGARPGRACPVSACRSPRSRKAIYGAEPAAQEADRSVAYYHLALANIYEDQALENGNTDAARLAADEYKSALNADPNSPQLNDGLADLYFRTGHVHDAEITARGLLKTTPATSTRTSCSAAFICAS